MAQSATDFSTQLWAAFTSQRPEPDDPALRYGGAGRNEEKLRHFTSTPFYQALFPETQNILRHIRRVEWLRLPQVEGQDPRHLSANCVAHQRYSE